MYERQDIYVIDMNLFTEYFWLSNDQSNLQCQDYFSRSSPYDHNDETQCILSHVVSIFYLH